MTKPAECLVHPAITQISLGICPVFTVCLMGRQGPKVSSCGQRDSDQTGRMPSLIYVSSGCTGNFVGFVKLLSSKCCFLGVHSVAYAFPKVKIVTTAVDKAVNDKFHILPGIGK